MPADPPATLAHTGLLQHVCTTPGRSCADCAQAICLAEARAELSIADMRLRHAAAAGCRGAVEQLEKLGAVRHWVDQQL